MAELGRTKFSMYLLKPILKKEGIPYSVRLEHPSALKPLLLAVVYSIMPPNWLSIYGVKASKINCRNKVESSILSKGGK